MAISGKGEGKAKGAAKDTPRVPRARGRLDWSMIYRNATSSDLALQLPFLQVSESMGNHDSKIVDAASVD